MVELSSGHYAYERYWMSQAEARLGPLPKDYLVFDLETSGLDKKKDLILQFGYVTYRAGEITSGSWLLNWPDSGLADNGWLAGRIQNVMANWKAPRPYLMSVQALKRRGVDPVAGLQQAETVLRGWLESGGSLVAHNGVMFDVPFVRRQFQDYLGVQVPDLHDRIIDTGLIEKAIDSRTPIDSARTWGDLNRLAVKIAAQKAKWSLHAHCAIKYGLDLGPEQGADHDALYDSIVTARLLESYRSLASISP